ELSAVGESSATRTRMLLRLDMVRNLCGAIISSHPANSVEERGGEMNSAESLRSFWYTAWAAGLAFDDAVAHRVADQVHNGVQVEFQHDVGAVRLRGSHADAENPGHFLVAFPFGQELHDFALPLRQTASGPSRAYGRVGAPRASPRNTLRHARRCKRFVPAEHFDSGDERAVRDVLEDVTQRPGFENLLNHLLGVVHGENEHLGLR